MLSTAEMLLGLARHLDTYGASQPKADLGTLGFVGHIIEIAARIRGTGVTNPETVCAMALDAGITKRETLNEILPVLETLDLIEIERRQDHQIYAVSEKIPQTPQLFNLADQILRVTHPEPVELMALKILESTIRMPTTTIVALDSCSSLGSEEIAQRAIDDLKSLRLCSEQISDDNEKVLFNPNIWAVEKDYTTVAIRAQDPPVREALTSLLDEVGSSNGLPESDVTSTEKKWIDYAVSKGLLLRSIVATVDGTERAFLFTPHMGRSAFDTPTGADPTGHVRQLIGSMMFARRFATNRLFSPVQFLNKLVALGEAGDASNISTDYSMLETSGIVRVERAAKYHKFVLLKADVAEEAISYLEERSSTNSDGGQLGNQRMYRHPEVERARYLVSEPLEAIPSEGATNAIISVLRQEAGRRRYDG